MKKISPEFLATLAATIDEGSHIAFRDEIRYIDGPWGFDQKSGGEGARIKVVFASGFAFTSFQGDKFFDAFCRLPVGDKLTYSYSTQKDARGWEQKKETDTGTSISEHVSQNGDLDGFEVIEHVKGTTSEVFNALMADPNVKVREISRKEKQKPAGGGVGGAITDLPEPSTGDTGAPKDI